MLTYEGTYERDRERVLYFGRVFCFAVVLKKGFNGDVEFCLRHFVALLYLTTYIRKGLLCHEPFDGLFSILAIGERLHLPSL